MARCRNKPEEGLGHVACHYGDMVNGYLPMSPDRAEAGGVVWTLDRPAGLYVAGVNRTGWFCLEHHEQLLLLLLNNTLTYDAICHEGDKGRYDTYVAQGKRNLELKSQENRELMWEIAEQ